MEGLDQRARLLALCGGEDDEDSWETEITEGTWKKHDGDMVLGNFVWMIRGGRSFGESQRSGKRRRHRSNEASWSLLVVRQSGIWLRGRNGVRFG